MLENMLHAQHGDGDLFARAMEENPELFNCKEKEFLPVKLSREEIRDLACRSLASICDASTTTNQERRARTIKSLRIVEGIDMQILMQVLDEILTVKNN